MAEDSPGELGRGRIERRNTISTVSRATQPTANENVPHIATDNSHTMRSSSDPILPQTHDIPTTGETADAPNTNDIAEMVRSDIRRSQTRNSQRPSSAPSKTLAASNHPPLPRHFYSAFQTNSSPYPAQSLQQYSANSINRRGHRSNLYTSVSNSRRPRPGPPRAMARSMRGILSHPHLVSQHPSLPSSYSSSRHPSRPTTGTSRMDSSASSISRQKVAPQAHPTDDQNSKVPNNNENDGDYNLTGSNLRSNTSNTSNLPNSTDGDVEQNHTGASQDLHASNIAEDARPEILPQSRDIGASVTLDSGNQEACPSADSHTGLEAVPDSRQKKEALKAKFQIFGEKLRLKRDYWRSRMHK